MLTLTSNEILELFDIRSPGTLTKWRGLGAGAAVIGRNRWSARAFLEWWLSVIYDGTCAETDGTLAEARREYWQAKAESERLKVDREKGQFIPVDEVIRDKCRMIDTTVAALANLPARIGPQMLGLTDQAEAMEKIRVEVDAMRVVLHAGRPYCDETAEEALSVMGGMSPTRAKSERSRALRSMPIYMDFNPRTRVYTDKRDNTEVPEAAAEQYVRSTPYKKIAVSSNEEEKSQPTEISNETEKTK